MRKALTLTLIALLAVGVLATVGTVQPADSLAQAGPSYVGSEKCAACHAANYDTFRSTGHPYKLRLAADARAAGIPKPDYVSWDDILFVIGGFKWKARYVGQDGNLITQSKDGAVKGKNQFNLETEQFVDYNAGNVVAYTCGECHTTGYNPQGNQLGKPGLVGTWTFNGVQCEACHGPASNHIATPSKATIKVDKSAELCGQCHRRGKFGTAEMDVVPAVPPFVDHREQYQELRQSPHKNLTCVTCHDPHKRARLVQNTCATCHAQTAADFKDSKHDKGKISCERCHMANADKTAVQRGPYEGDLPNHFFKINTDPAAKMFTDDGKFAKGYLTLSYSCLPCHSDRNVQWAAQNAKGVHKLGK